MDKVPRFPFPFFQNGKPETSCLDSESAVLKMIPIAFERGYIFVSALIGVLRVIRVPIIKSGISDLGIQV